MLKNEREELKESGKMFALTMVLTNFLLAAVAVGVVWLVQLILNQNIRLTEAARGFSQL